MSNTRSPIQKIPLNSTLNLNTLKSEVQPFQGFNKNNSPVFGGCLSPLFQRDYEKESGVDYEVDNQGNVYTSRLVGPVAVIYKNGTPIGSVLYPHNFIHKNVLSTDNPILCFCVSRDGNSLAVLTNDKVLTVYSIPTLEKLWEKQVDSFDYERSLSWCLYMESSSSVFVFNLSYPAIATVACVKAAIVDSSTVSYTSSLSTFSVSSNPLMFVRKVDGVYLLQCFGTTGPGVTSTTGFVTYIFSGTSFASSSGSSYEFDDPSVTDLVPNVIGQDGKSHRVLPNLVGTTSETVYVCLGCDVKSVDFSNNKIILDSSTKESISLNKGPDTWDVVVSGTTYTIKRSLKVSVEITPYSIRSVLPRDIDKNFEGQTTKFPYHVVVDYLHPSGEKNRGGSGYSLDSFESAGPGAPITGARFELDLGIDSHKAQFVPLINDGQVFGISSALHQKVGALVVDWNSIPTDCSLAPSLYTPTSVPQAMDYSVCATVSASTGKLTLFYHSTTPSMEVVLGKFLVLHIGTEKNLYDISKNVWYNGFLDYNSSIDIGIKGAIPDFPFDITNYTASNGYFQFPRYYGSAMYPYYKEDKVPFSGFVSSPRQGCQLLRGIPNQGNPFYTWTSYWVEPLSGSIDLFVSQDETGVATYWWSFYRACPFPTLKDYYKGYAYPTTSGAWFQPLSIFSEFVYSFTNNDAVIEDGTGYFLEVDNGSSVLAVAGLAGTGISGLKSLAIVQGQMYAITDEYLYRVTMSNGALQSIETVVSIVGLQFVGFSPRCIYFYSAYNRTIYAFTGDVMLSPVHECTEISSISSFGYNPSTSEVYLATNVGVLVLGITGYMYMIPIVGAEKISASRLYAVIETSTSLHLVRLTPAEDFEKKKVEVHTCYYGMGNQQVSKVDTIYLRLFNPERTSGKVSLCVRTMTNSGYSTENKEVLIKETDWDKQTSTFYLRYQPRYQTSVGTSVEIESDFAIHDINIGVTPAGVSQVSHANV